MNKETLVYALILGLDDKGESKELIPFVVKSDEDHLAKAKEAYAKWKTDNPTFDPTTIKWNRLSWYGFERGVEVNIELE